MNNTNIPAQTEQNQTTRLNIDFSHRMPDTSFDIFCPHNLSDAVNQSTDRATGVLYMLAGQFIGEEDCRLNDGIIYNVIESVIRDIQDINSIVNAFSHAAVLAPQNQQA
ncbi:MAG: hypothetical protein RIR39_708 [Pseudomonadota bacterium]|jgi:hypothetical protein